MRKNLRAFRKGRSQLEMNMAPLIGMIFILLIFFIVTTSFVKEAGVEVKRPNARTAVRQEEAGLIVGVTKEGTIYIEGRPVDIRSVRTYMERFLAEHPGGSVPRHDRD